MVKINSVAIGMIAAVDDPDDALKILREWLPEADRADCQLMAIEQAAWATARHAERKLWLRSAYARADRS